ncbi:hypothetical protein Kpol_1010p25 [Vanderwaltozyma polyspora DSM 70294]|uniref:Lethal giant larvae (Lgl)-like C-terminal domain-containing protein n=1 Tax=Vanderwaltozyma polyspora (strain ATCC 22028 / DSM 70294 / BCRC 21397 / CBS 2163 / NBRC 10782 / NRRL Y-8283 / UCD 57-17) TaxID=436907 RepID=A7TIH2_VANPO|nr:uncharacterized protein Kpol_1010p25 [Vanderwaltozyma polyspora DSM 70294]EDO17910.1 hypothetical protein Kpol_1010p25 [Vanderwaltozyma polyspora DSM 70294]
MFKGKKLKDVLKSSSKSDGQTSSKKASDSGGSSRFKSMSSAFKSSSIPEISSSGSGMSRIFAASEINKHGIRGRITATAFDQTQSLLAIATDAGDLHVYGQKQVEVVFTFDGKAPIKEIIFIKGIYLAAIDEKDVIMILSLYSKKVLTTVFTPGKLTCVETDPSLDWILLGLQSGTIIAYDVDRDQMSHFKIENLQKLNFFKKGRVSPVVSMQWNPRDLATVLISYEQSTVIFSLADNSVKQHFIYELPPNAPGGEYSMDISETRYPKVIQSLYHPNSLHILTVHEDNSLVFWDANTGQLIQARTCFETDVHKPQPGLVKMAPTGIPRVRKAAWICQNNPEYTSLLIANSFSEDASRQQNLVYIDLGGTPLYTLTTYDAMSKFYSRPKEQKIFPLLKESKIVNFLPLPRASPFFGGSHDPAIILLFFENGEMETMLFPSGALSTKSTLLPQSLSWVRPFATKSVGVSVPKKLWLGMMSNARNETGILKGGFPVKKDTRVQEVRSAIATGHSNGSVRIWDASPAELEDTSVYEVNLGSILNVGKNFAVTNISFSADTLELSVAIESGDVVFFKFETNPNYSPNGANEKQMEMKFRRFSLNSSNDVLIDVSDRAPTNMNKGMIPSIVVHLNRGAVSAVRNSNIGFVAIAYKEGSIILVDRRGPAIIHSDNLKKISRLNSNCVTYIDFFILEYGAEGYSSIVMLCGTDAGELLTYKILPAQNGRFVVELIEVVQSNDPSPVRYIGAFDKTIGRSCIATIAKMQELSKGVPIPGYVVVATEADARIVKVGKSKESHKSFKAPVASSSLSFIPYLGSKGEQKLATVLVNILVNGEIKILSTPDLKEVKSLRSPVALQSKYMQESSVLENGDILVRSGQFNAVLLSVVNEFATGLRRQPVDNNKLQSTDTLYNPTLKIPYRPQVSSLQWARGTVMITASQLDSLLSGEKRPPSKYEESAIALGTVTLKPPKKSTQKMVEAGGQYKPEDMAYKVPVRHNQKSGGYGIFKSVARTVETQYDYIESNINEYATAMGDSMNEAMEDTSKDLMKGAIGF